MYVYFLIFIFNFLSTVSPAASNTKNKGIFHLLSFIFWADLSKLSLSLSQTLPFFGKIKD